MPRRLPGAAQAQRRHTGAGRPHLPRPLRPPPQPTEPAWDEDAEYERLYTQCTAGCAEADRTTPSPQDPEKTICAFICDYSATSAVELKSCQLRCQHDHGDNKDTAHYRQCLNACNPDHVEDDPTDSPR